MQCPQLRLIHETWDGAETPRIRLFHLKVFEKEDARPFLSLKLKNDSTKKKIKNIIKMWLNFIMILKELIKKVKYGMIYLDIIFLRNFNSVD